MFILRKTAIRELAKAQQALLKVVRTPVKKSRWLTEVLAWCREHDIELGDSDARQFWISRAGIVAIERWLALNNQSSLKLQAEQRENERSDVLSSNEKNASVSPMQHRVLVASCDLGLRLNQQQFFMINDTPEQVIVELSVSDIALSSYDYLVVVENRDSFNDWHRFAPLAVELDNPLVIYRGHERNHSKGCTAIMKRWRDGNGERGLVYFGDADVSGLNIAISSKVPYQHLLLPAFECLTQHVDPLLATPEHDFSLRDLTHRLPAPWLNVFELIYQQGALRQQKMFKLPLALY